LSYGRTVKSRLGCGCFLKQLPLSYFPSYFRFVKVNRWQQVKDRANRRARGLWKRNGSYYVQTTINDPLTGLKKVSRIRLPDANDIDSAKTEAGKLRQRIAAGETIHGKQGPTFTEYREHYIKTALKKPKTLYNENYFLKAWEEFLGKDLKIGSVTKQNVLAFRVQLVKEEYSRLSRNLHFITTLQNSKISFCAADNPHATPFLIHILVAVAEFERNLISSRTKAALEAARKRGMQFGNP
jgi:hypothetical protein